MIPRLQPGMVVKGFRLEERIHVGNMSVLWRVTAPGQERSLVMKVPLLNHGQDPASIVGFEVEQMILPTLAGIHVPQFLAAGDFSDQAFIVMEYIAGNTLRVRLADAPLPPAEVASIGARIATALHELHSQHVVHLDVKPSNIMFRETGEAVLIDYGLAHHDRLPDLLAEELKLPMGTGPYISPEQVLHVRNEPRSDIFALGVVLYHLATGVRPFGNPTNIRGLRRRLYRDPVPPRALAVACPLWLQEIILHCLEVDADARYGTAAQVAFECNHANQVVLGPRSRRMERDGMATVAKRWFRSMGTDVTPRRTAEERLSLAPFIVVALDLTQNEKLAETIRGQTQRIMLAEPASRLACVSVLRTSRIGVDADLDEEGRHLHVTRLVELKHWAKPLDLAPGRISYHVLEAPDPGAAIIDFVRSNRVDHVIMGARDSSSLRRYLGSVSSAVVAQAPCAVTVVRVSSPAT
jgi:serine/threonine protein kinase